MVRLKKYLTTCLATHLIIAFALVMTTSLHTFNIDLYTKISQTSHENKNTIFSPYSIHSSLSMVYAGARAHTREEMRKTLYKSGDIPKKISEQDGSCKLYSANKLYVHNNYTIRPDFIDTITNTNTSTNTNNSCASLETVNFSENIHTSDIINQWVADKTKNKITQLVSPRDFTPLTRLVLINSLYFNGKWEKPFKEIATQPSIFYKNKTENTIIDMMLQTEQFNYIENETIQMLEMPYHDSSISMYIILPKELDGLHSVESTLSDKNITELINKLEEQEIIVKLPKFKIESSYELKNTLAEMGIPSLIDSADFSGIAGQPGELQLSKIIHKACIEVVEEGTQAAAATSAIIAFKSFPNIYKSPFAKVFNADHPFIFLLRDKTTENVLFMGKVCNL